MRNVLHPAGLALVLLLTAAATGAQESDDPYASDSRIYRDRVRLDVGWVFATWDSDATLDPSGGGSGTTVDLEDDVRLGDRTDDFYVDGHYRFRPRHRLELSYYSLARSASYTLQRTIEWGDSTFDIGADVKADSDVQLASLGYAWSFVRNDRVEATLEGAVSYIETNLSLEGTTNTGSFSRERGNADIPYPTLGLSIECPLHRRVSFDASVAGLGGVKVSGVEASIVSATAGFRFYPARHVGIGVHWLAWQLDANTTDTPRELHLDWGWNGGVGSVSFVW
jgi:hypothetical protein